jgi:hypothetical protein
MNQIIAAIFQYWAITEPAKAGPRRAWLLIRSRDHEPLDWYLSKRSAKLEADARNHQDGESYWILKVSL